MLHYGFKATFLLALVDRNTRQDIIPAEEFHTTAYVSWAVNDEVALGKCKDAAFEWELLRSGKLSFLDYVRQHAERFGPLVKDRDWYVDGAILSFETIHKAPS